MTKSKKLKNTVKNRWNCVQIHSIKYINLIYIYLLLLYDSSFSSIEHSPNYIGFWVIAVNPAFIAGHQSIKNCGIWIGKLDHLPAVITTSFFLIFSEHPWDKLYANLPHLQFLANTVCTVPTLTSNSALIVSIDTRRSLSMKFFIWPINCGVLTSLLLPHLSSSLTDSLPSLNLLCHLKTHALDSCKMLQKQSEAFHTFLWHFFQV